MGRKDIIIMSHKELKRLHVIRKVLEGSLLQGDAAGLLNLSTRQIRRITRRVRSEGDEGIVHRSRGRTSNRAFDAKLKKRVIKLYRKNYHDFGPTLASEKLLELNEINLSDETLRLWLIESGDWKRSRKRRKHRKWRERKRHMGEMVQVDGSHHDWFEGRAPACVLMGYIDDATGRVFARFYDYEGTIPAMDSLKRYIKKYGLPQCVYMDNHTTYKSPAKPQVEDELRGRRTAQSQFERAVEELGIKLMHAASPQAKGRIERLFGTFQDRMVKEMRLSGVKGVADGNKFLRKYLPKYNKRFNVRAAESEDLHMPLTGGIDIDAILCIKAKRRLRNDYTVLYRGRLYQILERVASKKVTVEERTSGKIVMSCRGESLRYEEIKSKPEKRLSLKKTINKKQCALPKDHPWRRCTLIRYAQTGEVEHKEEVMEEEMMKEEKELMLV